MLSGMRRFSRDVDGAALVEAAIVLPLLLIVTLGMFQFGLLLYTEMMVANAAGAGGIQASVSRGDTTAGADITSTVNGAAGLNASGLSTYICLPSTGATCSSASSCGTSCNFNTYQGQQVTVTVHYSCSALFVFTGQWSFLNENGICPISASVTEIVQ